MAPDVELLLVSLGESDQAGPDLAYDPLRHEIEQAFDAPVSIDLAGGGASSSGQETDWQQTIASILDQALLTRDIWLAVYLCRAAARSGRLELVESGAAYLVGLLERFWEEMHPRLDEYGVEGRVGACETLASHKEFVGPLFEIALVEHARLGRFTGNDLLRLHAGGSSETDYGSLQAALAEPGGADVLAEAALRLERIETLMRAGDTALTARAGEGAGANFAPVYKALRDMRGAIGAFLPRSLATAAGDEELAEAEGGGPAIPRAVRSRDDVAPLLDSIIDYYRRSEPQSPIPLLLTRAREWIHRDFLEVLEDIAPTAAGDARQLLHFRAKGE